MTDRPLPEIMAELRACLKITVVARDGSVAVADGDLERLLDAADRAVADERLLDGTHAVGFRDGARCIGGKMQLDVDRLTARVAELEACLAPVHWALANGGANLYSDRPCVFFLPEQVARIKAAMDSTPRKGDEHDQA